MDFVYSKTEVEQSVRKILRASEYRSIVVSTTLLLSSGFAYLLYLVLSRFASSGEIAFVLAIYAAVALCSLAFILRYLHTDKESEEESDKQQSLSAEELQRHYDNLSKRRQPQKTINSRKVLHLGSGSSIARAASLDERFAKLQLLIDSVRKHLREAEVYCVENPNSASAEIIEAIAVTTRVLNAVEERLREARAVSSESKEKAAVLLEKNLEFPQTAMDAVRGSRKLPPLPANQWESTLKQLLKRLPLALSAERQA